MSKDIKIDVKQFSTIIRTVLKKLQRYSSFLFIIAMLLTYSFLVFRISTLSQADPSDEAVTEQLKTIKRLKIDQNSIDKIQQLEDQNIGVQSLFEDARDNPFQN